MDLSTHPHDCNNFRVAWTWAARGGSMFPCHGKQPCRGVMWLSQSTKEPREVWRFWERYPHAAPAINLGKSGETGWFVLDCDVAEDGLSGWDWLLARCPSEHRAALEATPGSITPSGGRHLIWQQPNPPLGNGRGSLPPKHTANIDPKGAGGYIIAPGADTSAWGGGVYKPIGGRNG